MALDHQAEIDDGVAADAMVRIRDPQSDVVARRLHASLRRAVLGLESPPVRVGRFRLVREAGRGANGVVYEAHDPSLDRTVAIKILRARGRAHQGTLLREGRTLARLSHPNIVTIYEVGTAVDERDASVFVAMEFVGGGTLRAWMQQSHDWQAILGVFAAIAEGLAAAHAEGVVHGDFKPDNVLLDRHGRPKVVDFGLARVEAATQGASESGSMIGGTPGYVAPEIVAGRGGDARSDQYSFCVALAEALWGERPQPRHDGSFLVIDATRVPEWIRGVVGQGLAHDPRARHPSMAALVLALRSDPGARRRRTVRIGAVALVSTLAGATAVQTLGAPTPGCGEPVELFATVWNDERRDGVRARLLASELGFAVSVADRLATRVDAYGEDWRAQHVEACRATHVEHMQPETTLARRYACLERLRRELDITLSVIEMRGADAVVGALDAIDDLAPPSVCAAGEAERRTPVDPELEAEVTDTIRRALALYDSGGDPLESRALIEQALELAERVDDPVLRSDAGRTMAFAWDRTGDLDAARRAAEQALWLAYESGDAPTILAAAGQLVWQVGYRQADARVGQVYVDLGRATMRKAEIPAQLLAGFHSKTGAMAAMHGDNRVALAEFDAAIELRQRLGDRVTLAMDLEAKAQVLADDRQPLAARQAFESALALQRERLGNDHPLVAHTEFTLAELMVAEGDHEAGLALAERARTTQVAAYGEHALESIEMLRDLARMQHRAGRTDEALRGYRAASAAFERGPAGWRYPAALTHALLGELLLERGELDAAQGEFEVALVGFRETTGPDHPAVIETLLNLVELATARGSTSAMPAARDHLDAAAATIERMPAEASDRSGLAARATELRARIEAAAPP